jgi:hypothetical protein
MIYRLHLDAFSAPETAGISWKFIAKTGAVYWKKLEIFSGPYTRDFATKSDSTQIWHF